VKMFIIAEDWRLEPTHHIFYQND